MSTNPSFSSNSRPWLWPLLALLWVGSGFWALGAGAYPLGVQDIWQALTGQTGGVAQQVVWEIRLPRLLTAWLMGASLAASGAAYQLLFRNPLVSPDILGVSSGAALGAILGIFLGLSSLGVQAMAFALGLGTVALVFLLGQFQQRGDRLLNLVLTGLALAALTGAFTALLKALADPYEQLPAMSFWLMGSLAQSRLDHTLNALPWIAGCTAVLFALRWPLNALALGMNQAITVGVSARRVQALVVACSTLMTAIAVAQVGVVAWVGLIIPHAARLLTGPAFPRMLPVSMAMGAVFLAMVDTVCRSWGSHEIPLGVVTAMVGGPVFLLLLMRSQRPS